MNRRIIQSTVITGAAFLVLSWASGVISSADQDKTAMSKQPASPSPGAPTKAAPPRTSGRYPDITGVWGSEETGMYSLNIESLNYLRTVGMPSGRGGVVSSGGGGQSGGGQSAGGQSGGGRGASGQSSQSEALPQAYFDYAKGHTIVVDPPTGIIPYQPWALERRNSVMKDYLSPLPWQIDSQTRGWPNGIPRENIYSTIDGSIGGPIQILEAPGTVMFLYETHHEFRIVPLDGRPQPSKNIALWLGSSRGHWEGDTLVIDVTNQNDSPRLDVIGDFHSDEMRVTERWTYVDKDTLRYRATMEDPRVYTRPWTIGLTFKRAPAGSELIEYAGVEGDRDVQTAAAIAGAKK